ncbi:CCCH zinc finger and RRM domain protein [Cordyceps fumosorosea ARSEF 2679]|uniref:CCCH zinc finger and RRM domain protein n=1 Tax=Cordyceps fumosorosea (strain ARSEF 2679) TaxID=1081104 RepID=A0A162MDN4_CORFA|nr:CCCH zinc finger and RRM domain protein [Cordyceps fumosorosea ARSEF 2679]OAA62341.1 CCCH zinc finger and RRM domain protein [Cordyceps fumosorosea ARSEF 2679]
MLFPEEDAAQLKTWIVKRIENTSDADSDVLADYVIALLKHDGDQASIRKLCEEEIPDFLTEDPKTFLDDVFQAIAHKSYMPGAPPAPKLSSASESNKSPVNLPPKPANSRKRGFDDSGEAHDYSDPQQYGERAYKQPRRGGRHNDGFSGYTSPMDMNGVPPFGNPPPPTNPMEAIMALQAMGLSFPTMPDFAGHGQGSRQRKRRRCRDFDNKGFCSRGSACVYDHSQEPDASGAFSMGNGYMDMDMADMAQFMSSGPQFMGEPPRSGRGNRGGKKNRGGKGFRGGKAAFSADGPVNDRSKSTIVVENIPEESFSEDQVRDFFTQFGTIQDVSMQPYKHLAIVKYSSWDEASAAYRSPKVIFDNRFVKVFWYKDEMENPNQRGPRPGMKGAREDHNGGQDLEQTQELDPEEFQRRQEEAQRLYQERESKRSELEVKRQELEKQQQELLAKHRAETEKLQAKLLAKSSGASDENGTPAGSADMLRAKLALLEQEAKILGIDPENPNAEDSGSFRGGYRGRGYRGRGAFARGGYAPRGRGSYRGNGARHAAYAQFSIDNRPKKVAITGVDLTPTEKDEALRHFLISNGEFESVETGAEKTTVSFPDRKTAEKFYFSLQGKELPGVSGTLEVSWVNTPLPPVPASGPSSSSTGPSANDKAVAEPADEDFVNLGDAGEDYTATGAARQEEPRREVNMDYEMPDEEAW